MKLEKLTKEQEELMFKTAQEWIDLFNNTKRINQKDFEEGIKWLYKDLLEKKNPKVLYCESWLEALVTIYVLQNNVGANVWANVMANVGDNVRDNVGDNVGDNVWANVRDNVGDNVGDNVMANVRDNVRANVWANVMANVGDNVRDNVGDNVRDNVGDNVWDNVWPNVRANVGDNVWDNVGEALKNIFNNYSNELNSYANFGWSSFYDYFEKIGVLNDEKFRKYKKLIKAGAFQVYEYENFVFAIQPPTKMLRNEEGQLNSIEEKAFEWSDGYGFNYINGFSISEELFEKLKQNTLSLEEFLKEDNEEVKSAIISFIQQKEGDEGIYRFFQEYLKEVDTFVDKKEQKYLEGTTGGMNIGVYTLFKGSINDIEIAYVRCYCPSTDRMFFLGVEPTNTNAKDAIASLFQVPKELKSNILSIARQGEKFSIIFDKETTKKLEKNEIVIKEYVSLSGEEYFYKMTYEF